MAFKRGHALRHAGDEGVQSLTRWRNTPENTQTRESNLIKQDKEIRNKMEAHLSESFQADPAIVLYFFNLVLSSYLCFIDEKKDNKCMIFFCRLSRLRNHLNG